MRFRATLRLILLLGLTTIVITGCSRDPNVRKQKYLESGQRHFNRGRYREAVIQFSNAIQVDSNYVDAHYELARTHLKLQQWSAAYEQFSRVLELQPSNYAARIDIAGLLIATHDFRRAREQTDLLLQQQPGKPQVHLLAASLLTAEENFTAAMEETNQAIGLDPMQWEPHLDLALLQMRTNQFDLAEGNFKKATELAPKAINAQLALGSYYQARNRYPEAEQVFSQAVEDHPTSPAPCEALARLYTIQGKKEQAESFLKEVKHHFASGSIGNRMLGDFYFAAGDLDAATAEYASLYRERSSDIRIKKNYTQLLILKGRLEEARRLDNEILKASPNDSDALIDLGQIQVRNGHPSDAIATLRSLIRNEPDNGVAHYHLATALEATGELAQAQSELENAVQFKPDLSEAYQALATAALRQGDMAAAEQRAQQLIVLRPDSPDGYLLRAAANVNRKQFALAETDVQKALALAPRSAAAYLQLGRLRVAQQKFSEAENSYQQALNLEPSSATALRAEVSVYTAQKQFDKAIAAVNAQIVKVPNSSDFYDLLGTVLFDSKKNLPGAETAFVKAVDLDKSNADAFLRLGQLQAAKGSTDAAIATCVSGLENNPREPNLYLALGELYESRSDWEKAEQMYRRVLEMRPSDPLASNNLAYVTLQTGGNVDIALNLAQTARRGMPESANAADTLGWALYRKGAFRSAVDLFQEALRLREAGTPENPTFYYHLALAYEKNGQAALAKQHFLHVLGIDPNYVEAPAVKKELAQLSQ